MIQRRCRICKEVKDLSEFYNNKSMPYGKSYTCKGCNTETCARTRLRALYKTDPNKATALVWEAMAKGAYLFDELSRITNKI